MLDRRAGGSHLNQPGHAVALADGRGIEIAQAYELFETPAHGAEVFSLLRDSELDAESYVSRLFDTGDERQDELAGA